MEKYKSRKGLNTNSIYIILKDMADARGISENNTSVYYSSVHGRWVIRSNGTSFWFVSPCGLCSEGHELWDWRPIDAHEAMIMKKADIIRGKLDDSGQSGWAQGHSPKA